MRYRFWHVFQEAGDGSLRVRRPLRINGVRIEPGDDIDPDLALNGFSPHAVIGRDLEADHRRGELVLLGCYRSGPQDPHDTPTPAVRRDPVRSPALDPRAGGRVVGD